MENRNQNQLYIPNQILNKWDPTKWGFEKEYHRTDCNVLHTYYRLQVKPEITIEIACSQYPENPNEKVEQSVELSISDHYELLAHIDSKTKMATLIRAISGKSPKHFAMKALE